MHLFRLARSSPQWLRASRAALLLVFTLNMAAHAAHTHDEAQVTQAAHSAACGYCAAFGGLAEAPAAHGGFSPCLVSDPHFPQALIGLTSWLVQTAANPRAPPFS
jgi:hypothetical protein